MEGSEQRDPLRFWFGNWAIQFTQKLLPELGLDSEVAKFTADSK